MKKWLYCIISLFILSKAGRALAQNASSGEGGEGLSITWRFTEIGQGLALLLFIVIWLLALAFIGFLFLKLLFSWSLNSLPDYEARSIAYVNTFFWALIVSMIVFLASFKFNYNIDSIGLSLQTLLWLIVVGMFIIWFSYFILKLVTNR